MLVNGCVMFTDIVSSSRLWNTYKDRMDAATKKQEGVIMGYINSLNGQVVKTAGDSVMGFFDGNNHVIRAVTVAIRIQYALRNNPIFLDSKEKIRLRIGICHGEMLKRYNHLQSCNIADYYGNIVNTAARMEKEVSPEEGFAICVKNPLLPEIVQILNNYCIIKAVNYCNHETEEREKLELLNNVKIKSFENKDEKDLNGVGENLTLSCVLKCNNCLNF